MIVACLEGQWLPSGVAGVKHSAVGQLPRVVTPTDQMPFTATQVITEMARHIVCLPVSRCPEHLCRYKRKL